MSAANAHKRTRTIPNPLTAGPCHRILLDRGAGNAALRDHPQADGSLHKMPWLSDGKSQRLENVEASSSRGTNASTQSQTITDDNDYFLEQERVFAINSHASEAHPMCLQCRDVLKAWTVAIDHIVRISIPTLSFIKQE